MAKYSNEAAVYLLVYQKYTNQRRPFLIEQPLNGRYNETSLWHLTGP